MNDKVVDDRWTEAWAETHDDGTTTAVNSTEDRGNMDDDDDDNVGDDTKTVRGEGK